MSDDTNLSSADAAGSGAPAPAPASPRVSIEPSPTAGAAGAADRTARVNSYWDQPAGASGAGAGAGASGFSTPSAASSQGYFDPSPAAAGADAGAESASGPSASAASDPSVTAERPRATVPPTFETTTHTVVKTKTKKFPVFLASLAGFAVGAVLLIALVMTGAFRITDTNVETGDNATPTQTIKVDGEKTTLAEAVAAKAQPSVVSIVVQTGASSSSQRSQNGSDSESAGSIGSGVVLDTEGNILTNYHVVEGAKAIAVSIGDKSYEADIVGTDQSSDLAVIKIKDLGSTKLTPVEIGDSSKLNVGEWVMAIGSPFGNEQSVSTGIVSALYRSTALPSTSGTSIYANMIQTDAAINPGNSGGALVDSEGKLIGINSIIESYSGSSSGVGFAIPINYANKIAKEIISGKTPVHPYLGVTLTSVNALSQNDSSVTEGAQVLKVEDGGPAAEAGIKANDVIIKIDDETISSADGLIIALREHEVGDKVKLTLVRDGKQQTVEVTLGSDEKLQAEQQDNTDSNGGAGGMTQDELLQYLEELMGRNGSGSGSGSDQGNGYGQNSYSYSN